MKINKLGSSDITVTSLGMGCWAYGGGRYWGDQSQNDVNEIVHAALDRGINYFDTAEVYNDGASESSLGLALRGRRAKAVIGTKISTANTRPETLKEHCHDSLRRLGTDYIDIYMLHWPINIKSIEHFSEDKELVNSPPSVEDAFCTLLKLKQDGKIREIGISNHGVKQMQEIQKVCDCIVVNELPYNLISRAIERDILPFCVENKIGVLGYMAMQQGILAGIYPAIESIPPAQVHSRHFHFSRGGDESRHGEEGAEAEIMNLLSGMKKMSRDTGITLPAMSLAWAMAGNGISCTLVGSRNILELESNIKAASLRLPEDMMQELNRLSAPILKKLGYNPDYYENRKYSRIC